MKYIFGVLSLIVIIVVAIILFRGDNTPGGQNGTSQVNLTDYVDSGAEVVYATYGRLVAEEERRAVRITISRNRRTVEVLAGYNEKVTKRKTFSNSQAAYDEFMHALKIAGFSRVQDADYESEKGVCPDGNRSIYQLYEEDEEMMRLWSTSCRKGDGNFGGKSSVVENLFQDQIPEYDDFADSVNI